MQDLLNQWHRQKARRTAASPMEYAAAIECYRPSGHGWKVALAIVAVLALTAWSIKP